MIMWMVIFIWNKIHQTTVWKIWFYSLYPAYIPGFTLWSMVNSMCLNFSSLMISFMQIIPLFLPMGEHQRLSSKQNIIITRYNFIAIIFFYLKSKIHSLWNWEMFVILIALLVFVDFSETNQYQISSINILYTGEAAWSNFHFGQLS